MQPSLSALSLQYDAAGLRILDQRWLPDREDWVTVQHPTHMVELIQGLAVRGAPLIGVAAALSLAHFAQSNQALEILRAAAMQLRNARPTAVNLMWAMDRMVQEAPDFSPERLRRVAIQIFEEDVAMCARIASHGAEILQDGDGVLTLCNTGGLATAGVGTALGMIREAFEQKKALHVYACETRPLLQGGRLTAWELQKLGIPHTLLCDSMAAALLRLGNVKLCVVGADRIAANGDFANKIGSYALAVLARHHGVPFYVAAPMSTVDFSCADGSHIPIEMRPASEVHGFHGAQGSVRWAPLDTPVFNPAFDVVPRELITGWILDTGVRYQF
jgi:methylthioribose-1-phosphate isomerase